VPKTASVGSIFPPGAKELLILEVEALFLQHVIEAKRPRNHDDETAQVEWRQAWTALLVGGESNNLRLPSLKKLIEDSQEVVVSSFLPLSWISIIYGYVQATHKKHCKMLTELASDVSSSESDSDSD